MLDLNTWRLASPHPVSFFYPVPAVEKDVSYRLWSMAALTLVCTGLVEGVPRL